MTDVKLSALSTGPAILATDLFYSARDAGGGTFAQVKQPASALATFAGTRAQRLVTTGGVVTPAGTDQIINFNVTAGTAPSYALPLANTRAGLPITFKDVGGQFATRNLTISRSGADTIEGLTSITLSNNYSAVTLVPANDGTTAGWYIL